MSHPHFAPEEFAGRIAQVRDALRHAGAAIGLIDEIAAMTALLVSDRVASMTGAEVVVDGGAMPGV